MYAYVFGMLVSVSKKEASFAGVSPNRSFNRAQLQHVTALRIRANSLGNVRVVHCSTLQEKHRSGRCIGFSLSKHPTNPRDDTVGYHNVLLGGRCDCHGHHGHHGD